MGKRSILFLTLSVLWLSPAVAHPDELRPVFPLEAEEQNPEVNDSVNKVARDLRTSEGMARRTNEALEKMIKVASWKLRQKGHKDLADKIEGEWKNTYRFHLTYIFVDLGDHSPLSEWLDQVYQSLRLALGDSVMKMLHLDDIWVLNYSIPVVLKPCFPEWDKPEYKLHFVPFAGTVTYWAVYIGCTVATLALDFSFFCSPVGSVAEAGMSKLIAPGLSDSIYESRCE